MTDKGNFELGALEGVLGRVEVRSAGSAPSDLIPQNVHDAISEIALFTQVSATRISHSMIHLSSTSKE